LITAAIAIASLAITALPATAQASAACDQTTSIGVATMAADGTITMRVRSLPPGPIAEGTFVYAPGHPQYDAILKHLGGLAPGESKPVPPWC